MPKAFIKMAYRQIIDASSKSDFEKKIFEESYKEFLMKSQAYNPQKKFNSFTQMVNNDGRANSLHYKTSFAVLHIISELKNKIPGVQDTAGCFNLSFAVPEFKILESSVADKSLHKVSITYTTGTVVLVDSFGEYLVLSEDLSEKSAETEINTFTLKMFPGLTIVLYREFASKNSYKVINEAIEL